MLVSVIVITYNSSRFVAQTLESILRQTYKNIELIVSDDCSTDDTFLFCTRWVAKHQGRFSRTVCTQTPHNGGICWNYNHALKLAKGVWTKYIAGDDILSDNCIERFICNIRDDCHLYYSGQQQCLDTKDAITFPYYTLPKIPNADATSQLKLILRYTYGIHGTALFANKSILTRLDGFDEGYPYIEDRPITYKFLTNGKPIGLIPEVLVMWRVYSDSVSHESSIVNKHFTKDMDNVEYHYRTRYCLRYGLLLQWYHCVSEHYINNNYDKGGTRRFLGYLLRSIDVLFWYRRKHPIQTVNVQPGIFQQFQRLPEHNQ